MSCGASQFTGRSGEHTKHTVKKAQSAWPRGAHLGAVACSVHRNGLGQVGGGVLQGLPGVSSHQLTQLACLAEGQRAQPMLNALRLHAAQASEIEDHKV